MMKKIIILSALLVLLLIGQKNQQNETHTSADRYKDNRSVMAADYSATNSRNEMINSGCITAETESSIFPQCELSDTIHSYISGKYYSYSFIIL